MQEDGNLRTSLLHLLEISKLIAPLVQSDGGVLKEIITKGSGWESPEKGDKVSGEIDDL